jgi:hypothetical protein
MLKFIIRKYWHMKMKNNFNQNNDVVARRALSPTKQPPCPFGDCFVAIAPRNDMATREVTL